MNKIRRFLIGWLFKPEMEQIENTLKKIDETAAKIVELKHEHEESLKLSKNLFENIGVGVDVHQYSPSWAVVCIQGKGTDFVKFCHLSQRDAHSIRQFISQFDRTRTNVDLPMGTRKSQFLSF